MKLPKHKQSIFDEKKHICSLFPKEIPPVIGSFSFGDSERVPLKLASREDGFDFSQHVAEDQRQLGQVPPAERKPQNRANACALLFQYY